MISGGFAGGGESSSARKAYLCSIRSREVMEVQVVSKLPRLETTILFSDLDLEGCQQPHDGRLWLTKRSIGSWSTMGVQPTSSSRRPSIRWASEGRSWSESAPTYEDSRERKCYLWAQYSWCSLWETPRARQQ